MRRTHLAATNFLKVEERQWAKETKQFLKVKDKID